jgi:hypothetical protein
MYVCVYMLGMSCIRTSTAASTWTGVRERYGGGHRQPARALPSLRCVLWLSRGGTVLRNLGHLLVVGLSLGYPGSIEKCYADYAARHQWAWLWSCCLRTVLRPSLERGRQRECVYGRRPRNPSCWTSGKSASRALAVISVSKSGYQLGIRCHVLVPDHTRSTLHGVMTTTRSSQLH